MLILIVEMDSAVIQRGRITPGQYPSGVSLPLGLLLLSNYDVILGGGPIGSLGGRAKLIAC